MSLLPHWSTPLSLARTAWDVPDGPRVSRPMLPIAPHDRASGSFTVEWCDADAAAVHRDAWADLATRGLEPNVFLDPDFALPAAQHLGGGQRPGFAMVWDGRGTGDRLQRPLVAVCAVVGSRNPFGGLASAWMHDLSTLGFPLIDRACGDAALEALLRWSGRGPPRAAGLLLRAMPSDGPTMAALRRAAATLGRDLGVVESWERAVLRRGADSAAGTAVLSSRGAKELRRQRRRLAGHGVPGYASARSDEELRDAVEQFLALEAGGWKGMAGTALLAAPGRTAFTRTMTRLLGRAGHCRVDSLTLDGVPVAMGIVLSSGDADFFWKTAYRQDLAALSPGVQFVLGLTEAQARERRAALTDSCAVPDHPMIDRLWRDRLALSDVAVSTRSAGSLGFRLALAGERRRRRLRLLAKRALQAWRRRRQGGATTP